MGAIGPGSYLGKHNDDALTARRMTSSRRSHEMNGTSNVQTRSVQLAVMAAPSASVAEAVAEALRRNDTPDAWNSRQVGGASLRATAAAG